MGRNDQPILQYTGYKPSISISRGLSHLTIKTILRLLLPPQYPSWEHWGSTGFEGIKQLSHYHSGVSGRLGVEFYFLKLCTYPLSYAFWITWKHSQAVHVLLHLPFTRNLAKPRLSNLKSAQPCSTALNPTDPMLVIVGIQAFWPRFLPCCISHIWPCWLGIILLLPTSCSNWFRGNVREH